MRHILSFILILSLLLAMGSSCEDLWFPIDPNSTFQTNGQNQRHVDAEVMHEIEAMPKNNFLSFVNNDVDLSEDEKAIIKRQISPEGYTHVKFSKYKQNGKIYLAIEQFYPRKTIGYDSAGHQIVTGGSGHIAIYKFENGMWRIAGGIFYD